MLFNKSYWFYLGLLGIAALSYFVLFWHLGTATMREWDEARNAVNTVEMATNGNYIVRMYNGQPDFWETKPPLLIWLQVLCVKLFGYGEWAFRLPSALAAFATVVVMVRFLYRQTLSLLPGVIATAVLLTTNAYTLYHCARSADHDALLILFEVCLAIAFYNYLNTDERSEKNKYLLQCFIFFTLAVYTKSIAVAMLLPGMLLFSLYRLKTVELLKQPRFYIYTLASLLIIATYYYLHQLQTPGYIQAVWHNELFPRYFDTSDRYDYGDTPSLWQYGAILAYNSIVLIVFFPALAWVAVTKQHRLVGLYFSVLAITFYLTATMGTYNGWYISPAVPLLAIVCGLGIYHIYNYITRRNPGKYTNGLLLALCAVAVYFPIEKQLHYQKLIATDYGKDRGYGKLFKLMQEEHPDIKKLKIFYSGRALQSMQFYYELYSKVYGYSISCTTTKTELTEGDMVMCIEPGVKNELQQHYTLAPVATYADAALYKLIALRPYTQYGR